MPRVIPISRIVSGAQTGADRAALDFAIERGIPHGGWCPAGRRAEDGAIADCYQLNETTSTNYLVRTEWNVRDSDATVIFTVHSVLSGGSKRTGDFAAKHRKPWLHLHAGEPVEGCAQRLEEFLIRNATRVLNVAGSRGSKEPEVGAFVRAVLDRVAFAKRPASSCPFCGVKDENCLIVTPVLRAMPDSFPVSAGHTLVFPTRHVQSLYDLSESEQAAIWQAVAQVRESLRRELNPDGFNIGLNDGAAAGQTVRHAHVHVIPRFKGDRHDPRGGIRWVLPDSADYWSARK